MPPTPLPSEQFPPVELSAACARCGTFLAAGARECPNCHALVHATQLAEIAAQARQEEQARETASHRYHGFELVVGALEIAIVLASVSIVTRISAFAIGAATIGIVAMGGGLAIVAGLV